MRLRARTLCLGAAAVLSGCGGGDGGNGGAAPRTTPTAEALAAARTDEECVALWNEDARAGDAGQKSPTDFLIDLAEKGQTRALMIFADGHCRLFAPLGARASTAYEFAAVGGRRPWSMPSTFNLRKAFGQTRIPMNAEIEDDGTLRWAA